MRIATSQMYDRALITLSTAQERVSLLEQQLSSGLRVQSPSDDPIAAAQIELMTQKINTIQLLQKNQQYAVNSLGYQETIVDSIVQSLLSLRDLQVQAGNSILAESDRKALVVQAQNLLKAFQDAGNSKDASGSYIFSGGKTHTEPFTRDSSGTYIYNGDNTKRYQAVSDNLQIAINDPGDGMFMRILNGNGTFAINSPAVPNTGTAKLETGTVTNPAAYVADDYTLSFALNTGGQLVVLVSGATSGNIIPPTGLPDDAPLYQDGASVSFNGMDIKISGTPQAGDNFTITPSSNESIFTTVQKIIDNLNKPYTTAVEKAAVQTQNNQLLAQIDNIILNVSNYQSDLGARLKQLDDAENLNSSLELQSTNVLKQLREIDPIKVATEYNEQLYSLQIAQKSFAAIQGLSLFNYI